MKIPQKYKATAKITKLLATIEANKEVIDSISIPVEIEENIRRESSLGSALFSARIEGNTLTLGEIGSFAELSVDDKRKVEVGNLFKAIGSVLEKFSRRKTISQEDLLNLHKETMKNIMDKKFSGKFREAHEGIFDSSGNLIYHAPPPSMVPDLFNKLVDFINSPKEESVPIRAALAHLSFEEIHPFVDGNGRVGRLLQLGVLVSGGYGMKGLVFPEELIDQNRKSYYHAIEYSRDDGHATDFVELMLEFLAESSTKARKTIKEKQDHPSSWDILLPRRKEIMQIVSEQKLVSHDFLHRRFLKVPERVISYDIQCLIKDGYLVKIGKTRGALYSIRS